MKLKFNNITGLQVRVYEGKNREEAYNSIVEFNAQPTTDFNYRVKWNSGFLIVVVPDQDSKLNVLDM